MPKTTTKIHPLGNRVLVEPIKPEDTTPGGIVLPDAAKEKGQEGIVLAVGPGRWDNHKQENIPVGVKVGDRVYFGKYATEPIEHDGETLCLLREEDIYAIIS